jgi:hypothetical protein
MSMTNIIVNNNDLLLNRYNNYKASNSMIMYHITTKKNAQSIIKNGFDISLANPGAFGTGINLTTDLNHLKIYHNMNKQNNYIITCSVKFNKKQRNVSGKTIMSDDNGKRYSKPKHITPSDGFDILYNKENEIYVCPSSRQVLPLFIYEINF